MKILYRYIGTRLAFGWLLVFMILAALFSIMELVGQLDDIGKGSYRLSDAFLYVAYTTPGRVLNLAAVSSLLGSIVALSTLSASDELMAMRAGGFSVFRIARVVLGAGLPIMLGMLLLAQYVVPPLEQRAKINRELALAEAGTLLPSGGFWTRDNNRFVNVHSFTYDGGLTDVSIYEFDTEGAPTGCVFARKAEIGGDGQWAGREVRQIAFANGQGFDRETATLPMGVFLNSRQAEILSITPAMLSIDSLYQYILTLRTRGQNADQFVLALWQKTTLPLKVAAMLLFSLPFVFGSAREAHQGRKITLGAVVGISYYYFDQALGYTGLLLGLHPAVTTLFPLAIILLLSMWFLLRVP
jgi:lipopolysaccharide export system permease protein